MCNTVHLLQRFCKTLYRIVETINTIAGTYVYGLTARRDKSVS